MAPSAPDHFPTLLSQVLSSKVNEPSPTRVHAHVNTRTHMYTLTPRDLKVLRNVTGIQENLTPHTQETLAPNEMCMGHV